MVDEPPPKDCPPISSQTRKITQKFILDVAAALDGPRVAAVESISCLSVTYSLPFFSLYMSFFQYSSAWDSYQFSGAFNKNWWERLPASLRRF